MYHLLHNRQKKPLEVFSMKSVLKDFVKFTGKHLCRSLFLNEVAGLRPATSLKNRLLHICFTVNFAKCLRTPFLRNTSGRLLLKTHMITTSFTKRYFQYSHYYKVSIVLHYRHFRRQAQLNVINHLKKQLSFYKN